MRVKISKLGNDVAVRLPKEMAERHGLRPGTHADIAAKSDGLLLTVSTGLPVTLEELIAACQGPAPETVDWGPDVGTEVLDDVWDDEDRQTSSK